jgi:hypothetical protein
LNQACLGINAGMDALGVRMLAGRIALAVFALTPATALASHALPLTVSAPQGMTMTGTDAGLSRTNSAAATPVPHELPLRVTAPAMAMMGIDAGGPAAGGSSTSSTRTPKPVPYAVTAPPITMTGVDAGPLLRRRLP